VNVLIAMIRSDNNVVVPIVLLIQIASQILVLIVLVSLAHQLANTIIAMDKFAHQAMIVFQNLVLILFVLDVIIH
jgi:hypothetical protein